MHKNNFLKYIEFEKRYSKHTLISYNTDLTQFLNFLHTEYEISDVSEIEILGEGPSEVLEGEVMNPKPKLRVKDKDGNPVSGVSCFATIFSMDGEVYPLGYRRLRNSIP